MTYEDKKKLSKAIEQLPVEKASKVIQIIQKNMDLSVGSDEVEIDIDSLNNDTLLELQKYVNKCTQPRRSSGVPVSKGPSTSFVQAVWSGIHADGPVRRVVWCRGRRGRRRSTAGILTTTTRTTSTERGRAGSHGHATDGIFVYSSASWMATDMTGVM